MSVEAYHQAMIITTEAERDDAWPVGTVVFCKDTEKGYVQKEAGWFQIGSGAVSDHVALSDPHTQYQKESEKGAASGYASLGSGTKVPTAELGGAGADGTKFLRGDQTWAAPTASVAITQAEIDVGTTPVAEASVAVTDAGVTTSSKIIGGVAYKAPTGKDLDELEMDALDITFEPATGSLNVKIKGLEGYIADKFIIWYIFA